ncbi:MAG: hypothetical protein ACTSW4_04080 [Candidatus Ranarchaeia archaeon]
MEISDVASLAPEEKVNLAINMIDTCVLICIEGIREREKDLTEVNLLERVRERIKKAKLR